MGLPLKHTVRAGSMRTAGAIALVGLLVAVGGTDAMAQGAASPKQAATKAKAAAAPQAESGEQAEPKAAAPKKVDPAAAERMIDSGIKLLQAGKVEPAIQTFSGAIAGGGLPPAQMARAMYQRGVAYRKANKPALAISDLTSALWLKGGLQDADRSDAVLQRTQAYREAGLPDQTGDDGRPAGAVTKAARGSDGSSGGRASAAPVATASLAPDGVPVQAASASSGGFFANLFGGGAAKAAPSAPQVAAPVQAATSGWSSAVTASARPSAPSGLKSASAAPAAAAVVASVAPPAADVASTKAGAAGSFHARIALVRSQPEADAVATRLTTQYGAAIGGLRPDISQAQFGGMGAFYQVRVGPFANAADAKTLCGKLKGSGLDCVPVDR
jgi:SPOR domain